MVRADNFICWAQLQATPALHGEYWVTLSDITERKRIDEEKILLDHQLQQSQKLESLGVLSGGIAHDFNNILAIIVGNCYLAKLHPETFEKQITTIELAVDRAAGLCSQMLAYAGKGQYDLVDINMEKVVDDVIRMLEKTINHNVRLIFYS